MPRQQAEAQTLERALAALAGVDVVQRLALLGFPAPQRDLVHFRLFGQDAVLYLGGLDIRLAASGAPVRPVERILVLHHLMHVGPVASTGRLVGLHDFPGGAFYVGPFRSRTVEPLVKRFGNDIGALRANLGRFDTTPEPRGDLGARIHAFGPLHITLVYQCGDEDLGPSAEVLFDAAVQGVFGTEDAVVLASRICLGLL